MRIPPKPVLAVAVLTLLLIPSAIVAGDAKPPPSNPDAGLTDEQVKERQDESRAAFQSRLAQWYANLDVHSLDLGALPHADRLISLPPGPPSFEDAVHEADTIVTGTVIGITPEEAGTVVRLSVDQTLKGTPSASLAFVQLSTLRPMPDWVGVVIADSPGTRLLVPGTQGEFLLDRDPSGELTLQELTGAYIFSANIVSVRASNPFFTTLNGMGREAFLTATRGAAH